MKVRLELDNDYYENLIENESRKEFFEKYYNHNGVLFDDESDSIYYDIELPFMPIEGQRLGTRWGICIVKWAIYEIEEGERWYDKTRVIVYPE
jgi:hypothetical protein